MGVPYSNLSIPLLRLRKDQKCYSSTPYKPCPANVHTPRGEGLLVSFKALPPTLARGETTQDTLWWTDAQFLAYSDSELVVTTTAYNFRPMQPWVKVPKMPAGKLFLYDISRKPLGCVNFRGRSSCIQPSVLPHPLGVYIAYIKNSAGVAVINYDNTEVYHQPDTILGGGCKQFAIAPNGIYLATLFRGQGFYFLRITSFDKSVNRDWENIRCHWLCQDFFANRSFTDQVNCKWSADSKLLALCSHGNNRSKLFIFELSTNLNICTVCPDWLQYYSTAANGFDFDPRPDYCRLAVATLDAISIVDVRKNEIVQEIEDSLSDRPIDCMRYNEQGTKLAVAYQDVVIKIFDPDTAEVLHVIDVKAEDTNLQSYVPCFSSSAIMNLCFNFTGSLLASSVCDGVVRVWSIPCQLSLQEFCKLEILRLIPPNKVKNLNIPEKIKSFLLET